MGHFFPPPPPFMGGRQPYEPRKMSPGIPGQSVDNPPGLLVMSIVVPYYGAEPQRTRYLPVSVTAVQVDTPPFTQRHPFPNILVAWQPLPPMPQMRMLLGPIIAAVSADNPPFTQRTSLPLILSKWWEPLPPQPQRDGPVGPAVTGVSADNPPFNDRQVTPTIIAQWWQPVVPSQQYYKVLAINGATPPGAGSVRINPYFFVNFGSLLNK